MNPIIIIIIIIVIIIIIIIIIIVITEIVQICHRRNCRGYSHNILKIMILK